jgi:hypothetical protein
VILCGRQESACPHVSSAHSAEQGSEVGQRLAEQSQVLNGMVNRLDAPVGE